MKNVQILENDNFRSENGSAQVVKMPRAIGGYQVLGNTFDGIQLECSGQFFQTKAAAKAAVIAELAK